MAHGVSSFPANSSKANKAQNQCFFYSYLRFEYEGLHGLSHDTNQQSKDRENHVRDTTQFKERIAEQYQLNTQT
ncbi:hypothetical protein QUC31_016032 [Theobroma cacao]